MLTKPNSAFSVMLIAGAVLAATPAFAQAAGVAPGMQVVDTSGNPVGVVTSLNGANVVLKTDKHEVQLPAASFTPNAGKLLFGMTQAQVDAAAEQASAEAQVAIAPGAQVYGQGGALAGTIDSIDDQYVTIRLTTGELVRVPKTGVAAGNGKVIVGATAAQLKASAAQAQAGSTGGNSGS